MTFGTQSLKKFFKDKDDKLAIAQFPNALLLAWLFILAVTLAPIDQSLKASLQGVNTAILFAWAYLELSQGSSYFRRVLGGIIIGVIILNFFNIHLSL